MVAVNTSLCCCFSCCRILKPPHFLRCRPPTQSDASLFVLQFAPLCMGSFLREVNYALVVAALAPFLWLMWPRRTRASPLNAARGPATNAAERSAASLPNDNESDRRIDLLGRANAATQRR
ncbi:unnamed protein product [Bodo saltans]|uniref:Uncharacterized protein n=1 Tax=Bodo saltans TaxID=75058 RepID=A0A0S4KKU6_BODSA|nr:unnamed protein product [Bodo saltans]|eukprot:CUI14981.1 unnamed protein product [Bodo saltans]